VPRSLSSLKRLRQNSKRAARNLARKSVLKANIRRVRDAIGARDVNTAQAVFIQTTALLDRSANRGTVHPNTAARRKSRLAKRLNAIKASAKK